METTKSQTPEQIEHLKLLEALEKKVKYNKFETMFPESGKYARQNYPKQLEFFKAGNKYKQRLLAGGNRVGKTIAGAYEMVCHLTGIYPDWWEGRRFLNPVICWAAGINLKTVRGVIQKALLGRFEDVGSGLIPKDKISKITRMSGVPDTVDKIIVPHISGGFSELVQKTYENGRIDFQGDKIDVIWLDEEPKDGGIYEECFMRLMDDSSPGIIYVTFTPLLGLTPLVLSFLSGGRFSENGENPTDKNKFAIQVTWDDVPHLSEEDKEERLKAISPHLREARTKGLPHLGSGAIFPYNEDDIIVKPFEIPPYWPKGYGLDVGWERTAAVWAALDPDSNIYYIYSEYCSGREEIPIHAEAIKSRGKWMEGVIDTASLRHNELDGRVIYDQYVDSGLNLSNADKAIEGGILKMCQLFASQRLKVMSHCTNWITQFRTYRRDENGKVAAKQIDDLMDSTRYLIKSCPDILTLEPDPDAYRYESKNIRDSITGY